MSTLAFEPRPSATILRFAPVRPARPASRPRVQNTPAARSYRAVRSPSVGAVRPMTARRPARSCQVVGASVTSQPTWRLTERGIALVLVLAVMVAVAAVVVVGLTAVRVTGPNFQPGASQVASGLTPLQR